MNMADIIKGLLDNEQFSFFTNSKDKADSLKNYLKDNNVSYEASECGKGVYFSINCSAEQQAEIDAFLDALMDMEDTFDESI